MFSYLKQIFQSAEAAIDVFYKNDVFKNFVKFTGEPLRPGTLLKKRLLHRCFPVNFAKILRTLFYRAPLDDCV